jgi:CheY-like chemotaxis protein
MLFSDTPRGKNLDKGQIEALKTINDSGSSLLKMINDILDISKIEAGKQELNPINFNLKELIEEISKMFELRCLQKQLGWKVEGLKENFFVLGDEAKLKAILVNLIGNAVKFTESGIVLLKITALEKDYYLFEVTDTGKGIAVKNQNYIFEPFNQENSDAKQGGTGLGLTISNKQLKLLGSELKLKSELNKGSNFYFTLFLPSTSEDNSRQIEQSRNILCLAKGYQVKALVVDDVKENRDVLSLILSDLKIEVVEAVDGKDALEKVRKHIPDIIFMDIRMPVMNGKEAILAIQKEFGQDRFKIVVVTASVFEHQREGYSKLGCEGFIIKPFLVDQIYRSLQELLDVEFEYAKEGNEEKKINNESDIDFSNISIPETLYKNFSESIAIGNITMIEKYLEELVQINGNCEQLKELFIRSLKNYDRDGLKQTLEKLNISSP